MQAHQFSTLLQQYYGYSAFRPGQEAIIKSAWEGVDTLALLPTGGGKSVCYQIPALAKPGTCLVVSPLIALMKDQVRQLRKRNIPAQALYSGMSYYEVKKALENACDGVYKFLFLSPERLQTHLFKEYLPGIDVNLIAVDEAHCISQWGYDFRPPYLQIATLREEKDAVPFLALTASATQQVQQDIIEKLQFAPKHRVFRNSFARPNLSFSVFKQPEKLNKLIEVEKAVPGSGLVYCRSRRNTREIAQLLEMNDINAGYYHAGLDADDRSKRQDAWIANQTRIMVCTNAFGMGIDKPDVRTVVHMDVPDSLEAYYQEAGRAGRDGNRSYAVLLYNQHDTDLLKQLPAKKFLPQVTVQQVYQAMCNFLQLPVGHGEGSYFDFNLNTFLENFKLDAFTVISSLQLLQTAGYVSFNEQVFVQAKVQVIADRSYLSVFQKERPDLDELVKFLLRTFEGVMDYPVSLSERFIAKHLKQSEERVVQQLKQLAGYQVIEYTPKKDNPQLFFIYSRVPAQEVIIENALYLQRKKIYETQIQSVLDFVQQNTLCRSSYIRQYFGDVETEPCGICDICLMRKAMAATPEELNQAKTTVLEKLENAKSSLLLRKECLSIKKSVFEEALQQLLETEKIRQLPDGRLERF